MHNTVSEALDFAIAEEEGAVTFYTELAERASQSGIRELLLSFAREEQGHRQKLLEIKAGKKMLVADEQALDLKIADYTIDIDPSSEITYQEALIIAMKKEKAAYAMYTDLSERAPEPDLKRTFLSLAREEANHKLRFEIEYDNEVMHDN